MENFKPSYKTKHFEIKIEVFENCLSMSIIPENGYEPRYYEIIGAAHTMINSVIRNQGEAAVKEFENHKQQE